MADNSNKGFGSPNYDPMKAEEARQKGGEESSSKQDMSKLGKKGGQAAQRSGNAHEFTEEEESEGGKIGGSQ